MDPETQEHLEPTGEVTPPVSPQEEKLEVSETPKEEVPPKEGDGTPAQEPGAKPSKTVPYDRFAEVYAGKKTLERMLEVALQSQKVTPAPQVEIPETLPAEMLPPEPVAPDYDSFETDKEYQKAIANYHKELGMWGAEVKFLQKEHAHMVQDQRKVMEQKVQKFTDFRTQSTGKYEDFEEVVGSVPLNDVTLDALMESDMGTEVAYFLGQNPKEARRIFGLPEKAMLKEIGKLEAKISMPPVKANTITGAPSPIKPLKGDDAIVGVKKLEDMTVEEHIAYMDAKEFGRK